MAELFCTSGLSLCRVLHLPVRSGMDSPSKRGHMHCLLPSALRPKDHPPYERTYGHSTGDRVALEGINVRLNATLNSGFEKIQNPKDEAEVVCHSYALFLEDNEERQAAGDS